MKNNVKPTKDKMKARHFDIVADYYKYTEKERLNPKCGENIVVAIQLADKLVIEKSRRIRELETRLENIALSTPPEVVPQSLPETESPSNQPIPTYQKSKKQPLSILPAIRSLFSKVKISI